MGNDRYSLLRFDFVWVLYNNWFASTIRVWFDFPIYFCQYWIAAARCMCLYTVWAKSGSTYFICQ